MLTLPPLKKKEASRLRRLVKEWRQANPAGTRQRFLRYLGDIAEPEPPLGELAAAWRTYDEKRRITDPATADDAIAVIIQAGIGAPQGLEAYRYLVEIDRASEAILLASI